MRQLSVIIINFNTPEMTERAIRSVLASEGISRPEIVLIDNGSSKPMPSAVVAELGSVYISNETNRGFAAAVNQGIAAAKGDYLLLLNSDVLVEKRTLADTIKFMDGRAAAGITGARLVYPDGRTQSSFGRFPTLLRELMRFSMLSKILPGGTVIFRNRFTEKFFREPVQCDWVSGGMLMARRSLIEEIGSLDEGYFFGIEDFDFCRRAKQAGWRVFYLPRTSALHYHGFSSGGRRSTWSLRHEARGMDRFLLKHYPYKVFTRLTVRLMYAFKTNALDALAFLQLKIKN